MGNIKRIPVSLPLKLGSVNCYLVRTGDGFVLVDTGSANARSKLEAELAAAGCGPGDLQLIVLTHGDFDHTGNAAYLHQKYGAPIAMHHDDTGMVERGDMFWNRSSGNLLLRSMAPVLFRFRKSSRFTPDLQIADGDDLAAHGLDARVLSIPGHSAGSIGILMAGGELFCGDLLENSKGPATGSIVDDAAACRASLEKLQGLEIKTVYPGHGEPFPMASLPPQGQGPMPRSGKGT